MESITLSYRTFLIIRANLLFANLFALQKNILVLIGMIRCHLSRLMGEKKLKIVDVARDTGINRGTITRLYQETAIRVDFEVLDTLCDYFDCSIEELLEKAD